MSKVRTREGTPSSACSQGAKCMFKYSNGHRSCSYSHGERGAHGGRGRGGPLDEPPDLLERTVLARVDDQVGLELVLQVALPAAVLLQLLQYSMVGWAVQAVCWEQVLLTGSRMAL